VNDTRLELRFISYNINMSQDPTSAMDESKGMDEIKEMMLKGMLDAIEAGKPAALAAARQAGEENPEERINKEAQDLIWATENQWKRMTQRMNQAYEASKSGKEQS